MGHRHAILRTTTLLAATATTALSAGIVLVSSVLGAAPTAGAVGSNDWLGIVNAYRSMSGVGAITENASWSADAYNHSCYMLANGITHDEVPGNAGYTPGGDLAGNNGNVAVSSNIAATAKNHVDLWMTGPFHAIGVLRPGLRSSGFGLCTNGATNPWKSGATLDVLRGLDGSAPRPSTPIVFPGRNATISMGRFVTESPDPMAMCGWTGEAGTPLIAMMPNGVSNASATLSGPAGPIPTCVLHAGNTSGTAKSILGSANAVIVMPRVKLDPGTYTATVTSDGGSTSWSFTIDPNASLPDPVAPKAEVPDTVAVAPASTFQPVPPARLVDSRSGKRLVRLAAGSPVTVELADAGVTAVSANFTIDRPGGVGFLTVYNCTGSVPVVSTLNYVDGAVPNQAVVPLKDGKLCLYSERDTDVIIDVNGWFRADGSGAGFVPITPTRLVDTRSNAPRLGAGEVRAIRVTDVPNGVPGGATAVAVNLTAIDPSDFGFLRAFPCGTESEVSNVNFRPWENRPNSAIVPIAADGTICVVSTVDTGVLLDISGYFAKGTGLRFTSLNPVRLLDTRSSFTELNPATGGNRLNPGQVVQFQIAGKRGVPANAKAVSVNLTAAEPGTAGFVTAYPCGDARPDVSNLNTRPSIPAIANGAMVKLSSSGALCLYTDHAVHLIVDINGVWS